MPPSRGATATCCRAACCGNRRAACGGPAWCVLTRCDQVDAGRTGPTSRRDRPARPATCRWSRRRHRPVDLVNAERQAAGPGASCRQRPVAAFCGIGNPEAFRRTLARPWSDGRRVSARFPIITPTRGRRGGAARLGATAGNGGRCRHDPEGPGQAASDPPRRPASCGPCASSCTSTGTGRATAASTLLKSEQEANSWPVEPARRAA